MEATRQVLTTTLAWLEAGRPVTWVTVAHTFGASPRPAGSMMAISAGEVAGSVSGGCVEDDLIRDYGEAPPDAVTVREFGVSSDTAQRRGLPCGGRLQVVCERFEDAGHAAAILEAIESRRPIARCVEFHDGALTLKPSGTTRLDEAALTVGFDPPWRLVVTGAGELSRHVVTMGLALGYLPEVIEPRAGFRAAWPITACEVIDAMPDDYLAAHPPDAHTVVLALTHDMKIDDLLLIEALPSAAFYVGALGSTRTQAARRQRLTEHFGFDEATLARLKGPVGIDLGSREPAAIAISALAEITAARNGVVLTAERS